MRDRAIGVLLLLLTDPLGEDRQVHISDADRITAKLNFRLPSDDSIGFDSYGVKFELAFNVPP